MDDLDVPNCDSCLLSMEATERNGQVVWACPECGALRLSVELKAFICPNDETPMVYVERHGGSFWRCPTCKIARL